MIILSTEGGDSSSEGGGGSAGGGGGGGSGRARRRRTAFTSEQLLELEREFHAKKYLSLTERSQIATALKLSEVQVRTNFNLSFINNELGIFFYNNKHVLRLKYGFKIDAQNGRGSKPGLHQAAILQTEAKQIRTLPKS